jgi:hypothetical protein
MNASRLFKTVVVQMSLLVLVSCAQDPIFFRISQEVAPTEPRIEGAPTAMVQFERQVTGLSSPVPLLYVASGRLHWYAQPLTNYDPASPTSLKPRWDSGDYRIPQPGGGNIRGLAVTDDYLYALSVPDSGVQATLKRIGKDQNVWETVAIDPADADAGEYPLFQTIYADSQRLFVGSRKRGSDAHAILYNDGNTLKFLKGGDTIKILSGTVYDGTNHYLSTGHGGHPGAIKGGSGIWIVQETALGTALVDVQQLSDTADPAAEKNRNFMGMIQMQDTQSTIIAVERANGALYTVDSTGFTLIKNSNNASISVGNHATGALALWYNIDNPGNTKPMLLLAGVQESLSYSTTSGYTNGYTEFDLAPDGSFNPDSSRHDPGKHGPAGISSVNNNDRYAASLGKHPVNHLFQAPAEIDPNMTLFASTQTAGLWSYRSRDGENQWNAEE